MAYDQPSGERTEMLTKNYSLSPSYTDLLIDLTRTIKWYYHDSKSPKTAIHDSLQHLHIDFCDVCSILYTALLITITRYLFERVFCTRLVDHLQLATLNKKRFPESAWKLSFYTCTWSYCCFLVKCRYNYFDEPHLIWDDWSTDMSVSLDIKVLYVIQCGFYIHSIYATLCMDSVRKDFHIMMFHHFLTIALVFFSYALRYHKVGALVLFLHDMADMCLQATKLMRYMSSRQNGRQCSSWQQGSYVSILIFSVCWFVSRLYWFPLKVLYTTGVVSMHRSLDKTPHFYVLFNVLLWILLCLNVYWFVLILQAVYKAIFGGESKWGDVREYEEEKAMSNHRTHSSDNYKADKKQS